MRPASPMEIVARSSFWRAASASLRHSGYSYLNATRLAGSNKLWVLQMLLINKNRLEG